MKKNQYQLHQFRQLYSLHKNRRHYTDIAKDVEAKFDTSNYELDRPLRKWKNKKVIRSIKDKIAILKSQQRFRSEKQYIY